MAKRRLTLIIILSIQLLSILPFAHGTTGVPDQVNDPLPVPSQPPDPDYWYQAWEITVMQSFTPTAEELWAVDLRLSNLRADRASVVVYVIIREGAWDGPELGTASASVPYTDWPGMLVQFDFVPPIDTTPGSTYVIQVKASAENWGVYWILRAYNPYPGGIALYWAGELPNADFRFITYGPPPTPVPEFEASIVIMVSVAMMSLLIFRRLPSLIRRP